jgi:hypothetical protein
MSVVDGKQMKLLLAESPLTAGGSFKWPNEVPRPARSSVFESSFERVKSEIPMGTKVVRFPR